MSGHPIKAVIFDMGGVLARFPDPGVFDRIMTMTNADPEMYKTLEAFELGHSSVADLKDLIRVIDDEAKRNEVIGTLKSLHNMAKDKILDENFMKAIPILKEKGFKVALLTNNGYGDEEKTESVLLVDTEQFDVVVESCKVGMRKPNADIYEYTLKLLELKPEECVFVDDLEINIEGAKKVGLQAVRVVLGDSVSAINQLEKIVGINLK